MKHKTSLYLKILTFVMLLADIIYAILYFRDFDSLSVLIYAISSALIYFLVFSMNREDTTSDIKFYTIISMISMFLFTLIVFGPYFDLNGSVLLPTIIFSFISYKYFTMRNRYNQFNQVIMINASYLIIKVGLIFLMIMIIGLKGLGSI